MDNVIYRLGFAASRAQARQMVTHRHFTVNGHRMNIPSYILQPGDVIGVHETMTQNEGMKEAREPFIKRCIPVGSTSTCRRWKAASSPFRVGRD